MNYFVVIREHGPAWDGSRPMREQSAWIEHATYMNSLAEKGFVVLGGPVGDGSRILLIINADRETNIETQLASDPWTAMGLLKISRIEVWNILLGAGPIKTTS